MICNLYFPPEASCCLLVQPCCPCHGDCLTLSRCGGGFSTTRRLLCCGQACFGFLPPGEYQLFLCTARGRMRLLLSLAPGAQLVLQPDAGTGHCCWHRQCLPCLANLEK